MAGSTVTVKRMWSKFTTSPPTPKDPFRTFYEQINKIITDLEALRGVRTNITTNVENLAANADIAERAFFRVPANMDGFVVQSVWIVMRGASAGVNDANTAVVTLGKVGVGNIASKTYNTANQPAAANAADSLGTITNGILTAGQILSITVTQGTTADLPSFDYVVEVSPALAATGLTAAALSTIESGD